MVPADGIAQRHRLVETIEDGLHGWHDAFAFGFIERLLDEVGAGTRLAEITFFGEFDDHAFGASRDQACRNFDQRLSFARRGNGNFFDDGLSVFDVLEELFHF